MPDTSIKISGRILKAPDGQLGVLPLEQACNAHGNLADQVRAFGEVRGTGTSQPPRTHPVGTGGAPATIAKPAAMVAPAAGHPASALLKSNACVACHGLTSQIVGPSFQDGRGSAAKAASADDSGPGTTSAGESFFKALSQSVLTSAPRIQGEIRATDPSPGSAE